MQPFRLLGLVEWLFLFASTALTAFGNPLHTIFEPEELAARPKLDRTSQRPPTMRDADAYIHHNAMSPNLEKKSNGLNSVQATSLKYVVPAGIAPQSLHFFYEAIALKASGAWKTLPPERTLTITVGNLVLSLLSDAPISWDLVTHFADTMVYATEQGATITYNVLYRGPMLSASIAIALRVNDHASGLEARSQNIPILEVVKPHDDYSYASLHTELRVRQQEAHQAVLTSRSVPLSSTEASEPLALKVKPRTPPLSTLLKGFRLEKFHATAIMTPVLAAAPFLEDFYDMIALKVETGFWNSVPPRHSLALTRWNYRLKFFCYAAPVPWEFIQEVAIDMSEWAAKGFTAQYDAVYKAVDQFGKEIFVSVALDFLNGNDIKDDTIPA